jgi:hypothetical protein
VKAIDKAEHQACEPKRQLSLQLSYPQLQALWKEKRKKKVVKRTVPARPKSLRGRDFVDELHRLYALTGDYCFMQTVDALLDHGIVDDTFKFTRPAPEHSAKLQFAIDRLYVGAIDLLVEEGASLRGACAEVAARSGLEAASFEAAVKKLQLLHSAAAKAAAFLK